jgi:rhodanese-related sulfurtransferase
MNLDGVSNSDERVEMTLARLLATARASLERVAVEDYDRVVASGALVVDVRPGELRAEHGPLEGALVIGLNVLEWRLAPDSAHRMLDVHPDRVVMVVCQEGFSSSLAAHRLQQVGLQRATDLVGGFAGLMAYRRGIPDDRSMAAT